MQIKILVAEDDAHIRMGLVDTLESENYEVTQAGNGREALDLFFNGHFDMVILDVMMPEKSGYDVCRELRAKDKEIPVIMLTAKGEEIDKVVGLTLGADDYITKPFGIHELLARIDAVLRRSGRGLRKSEEPDRSLFPFGGFEVNPRTFKLSGIGESQDLTERELTLIRMFHGRPNEVLSRNELLDKAWGITYLGTTRTLDQHIAKLRKKLKAGGQDREIISTVHGIGYRYTP
ncbi:response regulator transcription factor [Desulfospira joergensenii]|uniref:response regulator transcription factor n=1 Tax=Desulfospira joergensenii TaxID=53329 RepID=UPI0003B44CCC|nr:response regulator transcription factor [Desulfospira joergensenii]